eukprot:15466464-Alexandrium_andersonii.AAC.1
MLKSAPVGSGIVRHPADLPHAWLSKCFHCCGSPPTRQQWTPQDSVALPPLFQPDSAYAAASCCKGQSIFARDRAEVNSECAS